MVDFISEVQEELRKDDYNRWLRRYGPYLAGLVVAAVAVTGYLEWKESRDVAEARAYSLAYTDASELIEANPGGAIAAFDTLADEAPEGYAGLSLMRAAALEVERGDRMAAVRHYDEAADVFERPRHAQLARLKAAYLLAAEGRYADSEARLQGLTEQGAPFEFLARELVAYNALSQNDVDRATREFTYLATIPGVAAPIAERSQQTLSLLDAEAAAAAVEERSDEAEPVSPDVDTDEGSDDE